VRDLSEENDFGKEGSVGKIIIKEDIGFKRMSKYSWVSIEVDGVRVGKIRLMPLKESLIIQSIIIFPEFERKGYAKASIDYYKEKYDEIIADRVRSTARSFWKKMEFSDNNDGNYVWRRRRLSQT
jgi:hypothetical protein